MVSTQPTPPARASARAEREGGPTIGVDNLLVAGEKGKMRRLGDCGPKSDSLDGAKEEGVMPVRIWAIIIAGVILVLEFWALCVLGKKDDAILSKIFKRRIG